jgi:hypothetical protein
MDDAKAEVLAKGVVDDVGGHASRLELTEPG